MTPTTRAALETWLKTRIAHHEGVMAANGYGTGNDGAHDLAELARDVLANELAALLATEGPAPAQPSREALAARLRELLTNDVIRATKALAQQRNVCREQGGQVVFVTGVEAAREYLSESLDALCPQEPT
jgi:hypothetical protein